jgi:hypothetical protein
MLGTGWAESTSCGRRALAVRALRPSQVGQWLERDLFAMLRSCTARLTVSTRSNDGGAGLGAPDTRAAP